LRMAFRMSGKGPYSHPNIMSWNIVQTQDRVTSDSHPNIMNIPLVKHSRCNGGVKQNQRSNKDTMLDWPRNDALSLLARATVSDCATVKSRQSARSAWWSRRMNHRMRRNDPSFFHFFNDLYDVRVGAATRQSENQLDLLFPCWNSLACPNSFWLKMRYRWCIPHQVRMIQMSPKKLNFVKQVTEEKTQRMVEWRANDQEVEGFFCVLPIAAISVVYRWWSAI
jgi:hypothetical protein